MHFWPNGDVFPCCIADSSMALGSFSEHSITDIWNAEPMRMLRRNMLEGKPSKACSRCYVLENDTHLDTLRKTSNRNFSRHFELVESTKADGSVEKMRMAYLDVRFSNLCNLRCLTCGPLLSSAWYEDQVAAYGDPGHEKVLRVGSARGQQGPQQFWEELKPQLLDVEQVYFAGGEPLLAEEHYRVLEYWLDHGKTDVDLTYTTNFTTLGTGRWDVLKLWRHFKSVLVAASLDASGDRAEYLRKGTRWAKVVANRERLRAECPHVKFEITPTIGAYNAWHFPDFHQEWVNLGLIEANQIRLNLLTHPPNMSIQVFPARVKAEIKQKYEAALSDLRSVAKAHGQAVDRLESGYRSVITFIDREDLSHLLLDLRQRTLEIDRVRNSSFLKAFPELSFLQNQRETWSVNA